MGTWLWQCLWPLCSPPNTCPPPSAVSQLLVQASAPTHSPVLFRSGECIYFLQCLSSIRTVALPATDASDSPPPTQFFLPHAQVLTPGGQGLVQLPWLRHSRKGTLLGLLTWFFFSSLLVSYLCTTENMGISHFCAISTFRKQASTVIKLMKMTLDWRNSN